MNRSERNQGLLQSWNSGVNEGPLWLQLTIDELGTMLPVARLQGDRVEATAHAVVLHRYGGGWWRFSGDDRDVRRFAYRLADAIALLEDLEIV